MICFPFGVVHFYNASMQQGVVVFGDVVMPVSSSCDLGVGASVVHHALLLFGLGSVLLLLPFLL